MPAGIKLVTLTSNYAKINDNMQLLRISHMYQVGEHPTLAAPIDVKLGDIFAKAGLKITAAKEMSLTANQDIKTMDANKFDWPTKPANDLVAAQLAENKPFETRSYLTDDLTVTVRPMEVRTFLVSFQ
jgi:hypothetical protein